MSNRLKFLFPILKKWDLLILFLLIITYVITFSTLSILRHNAFASNYDLANMGQTVWNTLHGRFFSLTGAEGTISRFSIHADLILVLLAPLYLIWDTVRVLLVTQSVLLGLGALPTYLLSIKVIGKDEEKKVSLQTKIIGLTIAVAYLLNPGLEWTNIYDFHGVSLAIPLLITTFYFAQQKKWKLYFLFAFLSILTKEQISLVIAIMGLIIWFGFKQWKVGLVSFLISMSWFVAMVIFVMPHYSQEGFHWALGMYSKSYEVNNGNFSIEDLWFTIEHSSKTLIAPEYYSQVLKPFGYIPILGLPLLVLSLPDTVINLTSTNAYMQSLTLHYNSGLTPGIVIATIYGFYFVKLLLKKTLFLKKYRTLLLYLLCFWLLFVSIRVNYHYSPLPTTPSCWCLIYKVSEEDRQFDKLLKQIPKNASIAASGEVRAHLTRREYSYNLPDGVGTVDYVAILDESRVVGDYRPRLSDIELARDLQKGTKYKLVKRLGHFYLFKKNQ